MSQQACCTCATLLSVVPHVSSSSEKPLPESRPLVCCSRIICGDCIHKNPRFLSYCPYCQASGRCPSGNQPKDRPAQTEPESLDPPPYSTTAATIPGAEPPHDGSPPPPPYSPFPPDTKQQQHPGQPGAQPPDDPHSTIHYLRHTHPHDTIASLSLRYGIPAAVLRRHNNLPSDHLLAARRTLLIPTAYCRRLRPTTTTTTTTDGGGDGGTLSLSLSLSPRPLEDEAERARKTAIRRWMVACKEADYDVAVLYLDGAGFDLGEAVARYWADVEWEKAHPLEGERGGRSKTPGKGRGWGLGIGFGRGIT